MTWFKVDDGFHCHPKALQAGTAALGLWVRCGSWAAQQLTDGRIPAGVAMMYGDADMVAALVASGLWLELDGGDYLMHDWHDRNPSREHVLGLRQTRQELGAKGGHAKAAAAAARSKAEANDVANRQQIARPVAKRLAKHCATPDPSRPDPSRPDGPLSLVVTPDDQENGGPSQEDQQTAELANTIAAARPGWTPRTVAAVIRRKRAESIGWHRITIALLIVATDPGSQVPHRIHAPGYWWDENDSRYQAALDRPALAAFLERKTA